MFILTAYCSL